MRFFVLLALLVTAVAPGRADFTKLENLRFAPSNGGDADSLQVTDGETVHHLRLYLVDAPETSAEDPTLARRVREQTRYFGLSSPADTVRLGREAHKRAAEILAAPFTAYTLGARGLGRSNEPRVYAFVVTAAGRDLGEQLVEEGWARAHGSGRARFDGVTQAEQRARLDDLELSAALSRRGIWAESSPDTLVSSRATERRETDALAEVSRLASEDGTAASTASAAPLDLNTATQAELERLPGVGPVLAKRILAGRPFESVAALKKVSGIGATTFARLEPLVSVAATQTTPK